VKLFASGLSGPPSAADRADGDIFIAETRLGQIRVLRAAGRAEAPTENSVFADKLKGPFGIAFYPQENPQWIYVAIRTRWCASRITRAISRPAGRRRLSWTSWPIRRAAFDPRDVAFSLDGKRLFISVGSGSNVAEDLPKKPRRRYANGRRRTLAGRPGAMRRTGRRARGGSDGAGAQKFRDGHSQSCRHRGAAGRGRVVGLSPTNATAWVTTSCRTISLTSGKAATTAGLGYYMGNHEDPRPRAQAP